MMGWIITLGFFNQEKSNILIRETSKITAIKKARKSFPKAITWTALKIIFLEI